MLCRYCENPGMEVAGGFYTICEVCFVQRIRREFDLEKFRKDPKNALPEDVGSTTAPFTHFTKVSLN